MSLADELLADLEEAGGEEEKAESSDDEQQNGERAPSDDEIDEAMEDDPVQKMDMSNYDRIASVAPLSESKRFKACMEKVEEALGRDISGYKVRGPVEADPEYKLVVDVNELAVDIDNEVNVIHKFVRDKYNKRFPELESLVPNALEYMMAVKEMGNDIATKAQNRDILGQFLLPATVIVVSVTATTSQGEKLTQDELDAINEACDMALFLTDAKAKLFHFVEQRMSFIAPNLSALVGAGCAAMLMGKAGGLSNLAKMPSCNIQVLGAQKKTLAGFSSTSVLPHCGFLYFSPLVQRLPEDLRRKATRQVSGKVALCARVDNCHTSPDGAAGREFAEAVAAKFDKWLEPPPPKAVKALPKPVDAPGRKRGGRRARATKERLGMTELRRRHNRINFAEIQEDITQTEIGSTLGQLKGAGAQGVGLRNAEVDQKTRARMSKTLQKRLARANQTPMNMQRSHGSLIGVGTSLRASGKQTAGTASSVSFTPIQGLEIVNPAANNAEQTRKEGKYFGSNAGFVKVKTELDPTKRATMMPPPPKILQH